MLCNWCAYTQLCPLKKHEIKTEKLPAKEFKEDDGVKLVNQYVKLTSQLKKAEVKLKEFEEQVFTYAKQYDLENIIGSNAALKAWEKTGFSFSGLDTTQKEKLIEILKKEGVLEQFQNLDTRALGTAITKEQLNKTTTNKLKKYGKQTHSKGLRLVKK